MGITGTALGMTVRAGMLCGLLALAGCEEGMRGEPLEGAGSGDTLPWTNAPFHGSKRAWQRRVEQRARLQNENQRIR